MAGRFVGEVMAAAAQLYADGLTRNGFDALLVVAEGCHIDTRQARVPLQRVMEVLNVSDRTASRAMRELVDRGLVIKLQRGHRYRRDDGEHGVATLYRLGPVPESPATQVAGGERKSPATQVAGGGDKSPATQVAGGHPESPAIRDQSPAIWGESPATQVAAYPVDLSGGVLRGTAHARDPAPRAPELNHHCPECDAPRGRQCVGLWTGAFHAGRSALVLGSTAAAGS